MVVLPGGFSGGDEPDGSGKFIASFLRNPRLTDAIHDLLRDRDGLMLGICNGFQALIKLGLVPYGEIRAMDEGCPTLTFNTIGRHQSRYVTTRVASVQSPWMLQSHVATSTPSPSPTRGPLHSPPGGAGAADRERPDRHPVRGRLRRGLHGHRRQPQRLPGAIEGIFSPDGRVFGKMGHSERRGPM